MTTRGSFTHSLVRSGLGNVETGTDDQNSHPWAPHVAQLSQCGGPRIIRLLTWCLRIAGVRVPENEVGMAFVTQPQKSHGVTSATLLVEVVTGSL